MGRIAKAVALSKENSWPVLVSGGSVSGSSDPSEAVVMSEELVAAGIPAEMILRETEAFNTIENAIYALPMLRELSTKQVVVVTSDFHMPRAMVVFETVFQSQNIVLKASAAPTGRGWAEHVQDLH